MGKKKGTTAFPVARIKKMMQADEDVGKIATLTPTLVGKALECMIEDVLTAAAFVTHDRRAKTIQPAHLREAIDTADKFDFLRGIVARVPLPDAHAGPAARAPRTPKSAKLEPGADPKPVAAASKRPRTPPSGKAVVKSSPPLSKKPRGPGLVVASGQEGPPALCAAAAQSAPVLPTSGVSAVSPPTSMPTLALPALGDALNSGPMTKQPSLGSTAANDNANDDDEDYDDEDGGDEDSNEEEAESSSASGSAGSSANKLPAAVTPMKPATTRPDCGELGGEPVMHVSPMEETEEEDNSSVQRRCPKLVEPIDFAPAPRICNPVPVTMKQNQSQESFPEGPLSAQPGLGQGEAASFTMPNIPLTSTKPGNRKDDSSIVRHDEHKATRSERVSVMSLLS